MIWQVKRTREQYQISIYLYIVPLNGSTCQSCFVVLLIVLHDNGDDGDVADSIIGRNQRD